MNKLWLIFFGFVAILQALFIPPGAGPDDDYHLASIYCAREFKSDLCIKLENYEIAYIPAEVKEFRCYAGDLERDARCAFTKSSSKTPTLVESRVDSNPELLGFYRFQSLFIDDTNPVVSVRAMRLANVGLIFISFLIISQAKFYKNDAGTIAIPLFLISFPFGFNLFGSNNPSLWALYGLVVSWFSLLGISQKFRENFLLVNPLIIGLIMIFNSRPDARTFFFFILVFIILINENWSIQLRLSLSIIVTTLFIFSYVALSDLLSSGLISPQEGTDSANWFHNSIELPNFLLGMIGGRGEHGTLAFGVYDLPMPSIVWFSLLIATVLISQQYFNEAAFINKLAIVLSGAVVVLSALIGLDRYETWPGGLFQPRYVLPIYAIFILTLFAARNKKIKKLKIKIPIFLLMFSSIFWNYATIKRYGSGLDVLNDSYLNMHFSYRNYIAIERLEWQPLKNTNYPGTFMTEMSAFGLLSVTTLLLLTTILIIQNKNKNYFSTKK